jgi:long-chain fatty acid transport protein
VKPLVLVLVLALVLVLLPSRAQAAPPDTFGFGSRETAMGGAAAAETQGFAASYYNPAALARSRGFEVGIGYFRADHALELNGKDSQVDPVKGVVGGLVIPGRIARIPVAIGVAFHLPDDHLVRARVTPQEEPRWILYGDPDQRLYLAANLAIEPVPWLWLGGGLSFLSSTRANLDITGGANIFRPDDSQLRHQVEADLTAERYPQAGVRVALSDAVALAAVYRGQVKVGLDLSARLYGDVSALTTALYRVTTTSVDDFLPQQVVLGGSWQMHRRLRTTLDATWIDWSAYVAPAATTYATLDIPPPVGGYPAGLTAPVTPRPSVALPVRMHDRVVPRLGLEWEVLRDGAARGYFRAGYALVKSPVEAQTGVTNYVDRNRHTLSLGLGAALKDLASFLPGTLTVDGHVQVSVLVKDTTEKTSAADLVGDYTAGGSIVNLGVTLGFAFGVGEPAPRGAARLRRSVDEVPR